VDLKTWREIALQRLKENEFVVHVGLLAFSAWGAVNAIAGRRRRAVNAFAQVHRTARWPWVTKLVEPYIVRNLEAFRQPLRTIEPSELTRFTGNRLAVLKEPGPNGEKGVLFAMVSNMFRLIHDGMDLPKLLQDYTLVFEPSWSGYCHADTLEFTRWTDEIFILAAERNDFAFLQRLSSNLVPIEMGPCDWVDPRMAEPYLANPKEFDIVMNSVWAAFKRHYVLFRMLQKAKRRYKVLLIGVEWNGKTRADVERLAKFFGVEHQVTIRERIPYDQVMEMTCRSRVSILLSLKEGGNRAIPESIFCNLPVAVLSDNVGGIHKNVVPETGLIVDERDLETAIAQLIEANLNPRAWALEHISCIKSSERLNEILRSHAIQQGKPWTRDIAGRSNSPESKYLSIADAERLAPWNEALKDYLR
jgi:hypothetical protein